MRGVVRALAGATGGERLCEPILGTVIGRLVPSVRYRFDLVSSLCLIFFPLWSQFNYPVLKYLR